MRRRLIPFLTLSAAVLGTNFAGSAHAEVAAHSAVLSGANEVPRLGDPGAVGAASLILDSSTGQVCFRLRVANVAPIAAAHIHIGDAGVAGPIVIGLTPPTSGSSSGCVTASTALVQSIIDNPSHFYVNVHNSTYPGGAARGQLL